LDDLAITRRVHALDLDAQVLVDEGPLLQAARHGTLLSPRAAATAPAHDQLVRRLALATGAPLGLPPRRHGVAPTGALTLAAAERVVPRVPRDAAHVRTAPLPAVAPRLAHLDQRRLGVAHLPDRRTAVDRHAAHLRRGQAHRREHALLGDELDRGTRAAAKLRAGTRLELDVVNRRPDRDVPQRHRVPRADLRAVAALQHVAHL